MNKNPCIGCDLETTDKNNAKCRECDLRVAYVASIGDMTHSVPEEAIILAEVNGKNKSGGEKVKRKGKEQEEKKIGTKNKLINLNNHMFAQMERLSNESLEGDRLAEEITRSKAVTTLSVQIIANARLALDAHVAINESMIKKPPQMLGAQGYEEK